MRLPECTMDFCIPDVPLDNRLQKERLKLVNKGSLSKRRKPSRYSQSPQKITEVSNYGQHITNIKIELPSQINKGNIRQRAISESHLNTLDTTVIPTESKKAAETRKNTILIQTWERRSQTDLKKNPDLTNGYLPNKIRTVPNGNCVPHQHPQQSKYSGKENRQSWKPVLRMPDPFITSEKNGNKFVGCMDVKPVHNVKKGHSIRPNRLIRPKSLCAINGSSNEEPEWISLSRKLCAKFVQSHLDSEVSITKQPTAEQNGQHSIVPAKIVQSNQIKKEPIKKPSILKPTVPNGTSEVPPWIDLSRKLCNKFIEDHIECEPCDTDVKQNSIHKTKSVDEISCNMRIVEHIGKKNVKLNGKIKDEPEWVNLSRRLRAKFIEGHKDDPDTISLDNQLNASDLEEYTFDPKYSPKINGHYRKGQSSRCDFQEIKEHKEDKTRVNDKHETKQSSNNDSTKSFCYWSDINNCDEELHEITNSGIWNGYHDHQFSDLKEKNNYLTKSNHYHEKHPQQSSSTFSNDILKIKKKEIDSKKTEKLSPTKYQEPVAEVYTNGTCYFESEDHYNMSSSQEEDVNYDLTFEPFEVPSEEVENHASEIALERSSMDRIVTQSKSLCDLSRFEPDSLECDFKVTDYCSTVSVYNNEEEEEELNNPIRNAVSVIELSTASKRDDNFKKDYETLERTTSLISMDSHTSYNSNNGKILVDRSDFIFDEINSTNIDNMAWKRNSNLNDQCHIYDEPTDVGYSSKFDSPSQTRDRSVVNEKDRHDEKTEDFSDIISTYDAVKSKHFDASFKDKFKFDNEQNDIQKHAVIDRYHSSRHDPNAHIVFVSAVSTPNSTQTNCEKIDEVCNDDFSLKEFLSHKYDVTINSNNKNDDLTYETQRRMRNEEKKIKKQKSKTSGDPTSSAVSSIIQFEEKLSNGKIKEPSQTQLQFKTKDYRSVELLEFNNDNRKTRSVGDKINGKRESLKEFDDANESYQAINPPFEFDAFEIPSVCSPENKRWLTGQINGLKESSCTQFSHHGRLDSSDSETPNSTPFDARTLVSPSSCASDSDTSSWTLTKTTAHARYPSQDTDYSDCSLSVKYNDTPSCSNQSTMENHRANTKQLDGPKKKFSPDKYSEVFVGCETAKDWMKARSFEHLDEKHQSFNGTNVYENIQPELLNKEDSKSIGNNDTMPESLRHLFNIPRNQIYTPTAKTSMLLSKSSEPLPCHYYSNTSNVFKTDNSSSKLKTDRSSSLKIKDIAQGILLTFRKFNSNSKSSQSLSSSHYVDVSHLAETKTAHKDYCSRSQVPQEIQRLNPTEYGKINSRRITAGYFSNRSTSESNLYLPSQLCTCEDLPVKPLKKVEKEERPKSFNFGMLNDVKLKKCNKKTPEMKEKKSKSHHGKNRNKKLETRSNSSVSRKVEQMADGTLCLVTTVSGDTAVPGVYSDSQDTGSEISTHGPVKLGGESNC